MTEASAMDDVTRRTMLARLAEHRALGGAPAEEHAWLVAHGEPLHYTAGAIVTAKRTQARGMLIVFAGHIVIRTDRGAGAQKIFEWRSGDVGGAMPYSRGASPPSDAVAEEATEGLVIAPTHFPEMIRACPQVTAILVHTMLDRARQFTSAQLRDEKLLSLGKLAAGLAHELNNPAAAMVRSSKGLTERMDDAERAARVLAAAGVTAEQFAAIDRARALCDAASNAAPRTPIERADREDELSEWLADQGATQEFAVPLAETAITPAALDLLARTVQGEALEAALGWITACCTVRALASEIDRAAVRISDLVKAVKGFSYMDHAPTPEPVDIRQGIIDTLTMLGAKTRAKAVTVSLVFPPDLPRVHGVGVELNQVWMNLIENALDAAPVGGHVEVRASRELDRVGVHIVDDGAGIAPEIAGRIFDPFFTTKGVGKGTGLGLDTVRRLLQRHEGDVAVESVPGRTAFQVRLPMER